MATVIDAQNALLARLQAMPGRPPIAYPNGEIVKALPRLVVQVVAPAQRTFDMEGQTQADAEIIARIDVKPHRDGDDVNPVLAAIQEQFRPATKFDGVTIMEAPRPAPAFTADGAYSVPVIIRCRFDF